MKNRKTYELTVVKGQYRAAETGNPESTLYLSAREDREAALKEIDEMNASYRLEDYAPEEIAEFWQSIDLTPVNEFFTKLLNLPVNLEKRTNTNHRGTVCYGLADGANIAEKNPVTAAAWQEMNVESFGCGINVIKETGELYLWATVHLAYRHWNGGTNGAQIGAVKYINGEWDIRAERK